MTTMAKAWRWKQYEVSVRIKKRRGEENGRSAREPRLRRKAAVVDIQRDPYYEGLMRW